MTKKFHYAIGWDVGAWHCDKGRSRDALCVLRYEGKGQPGLVGKPWRGNLRCIINEHHGPGLLLKLLECCKASTTDRPLTITLAIDTPLGWPDSFTTLLAGVIENPVPRSKGENPLLLRKTERLLWERGFKPLSAVQDMIGSQSTKGLQFLHRAGFQRKPRGIWSLALGSGRKATAIETYPSPCRNSKTVTNRYAQVSAAPALKATDLTAEQMDKRDAILCAIVAYLFSTKRQCLNHPKGKVSEREGWIWVPKDCKPEDKRTQ